MGQLTGASIATLRQLGGGWLAGPRDQPREVSGLSGRIVRAHRNLLEIFPQFVAALFVVHAAHANGGVAAAGAWLFFAGRLAYVPAYLFGPIGLRPLCWLVAQTGIVVVFADLLV
jgi:uncharacterized MAPEG superfamily protein